MKRLKLTIACAIALILGSAPLRAQETDASRAGYDALKNEYRDELAAIGGLRSPEAPGLQHAWALKFEAFADAHRGEGAQTALVESVLFYRLGGDADGAARALLKAGVRVTSWQSRMLLMRGSISVLDDPALASTLAGSLTRDVGADYARFEALMRMVSGLRMGEEAEALFEAFVRGDAATDDKLRAAQSLREVRTRLGAPVPATPVRAAPRPIAETTIEDDKLEFALPDLTGKMVRHDDPRFEGKVVVVDIWGTWCPPCRVELPHLIRLYEKYHERGLEIVGLTFEQGPAEEHVAGIARFAEQNKIPYTLLYGGSTGVTREMLTTVENFRGYPTTIFIGRDGTVHKVTVGFAEAGAADLEATILELLGKN